MTLHVHYTATSSAMSISRVLVYGGKGALGAAVVATFKAKNWVSYSTSAKACNASSLGP